MKATAKLKLSEAIREGEARGYHQGFVMVDPFQKKACAVGLAYIGLFGEPNGYISTDSACDEICDHYGRLWSEHEAVISTLDQIIEWNDSSGFTIDEIVGKLQEKGL